MCATKACTRGEEGASRRPEPARRGNIILLTAFLMVIMMAMVAFAVDVGYMYTMQCQLQRSVDAAALAGAGELINGIDEAEAVAKRLQRVGSVWTGGPWWGGGQIQPVMGEVIAAIVVHFVTDREP